jgi:hypothetical protein
MVLPLPLRSDYAGAAYTGRHFVSQCLHALGKLRRSLLLVHSEFGCAMQIEIE